jgi:hypothetical protein
MMFSQTRYRTRNGPAFGERGVVYVFFDRRQSELNTAVAWFTQIGAWSTLWPCPAR